MHLLRAVLPLPLLAAMVACSAGNSTSSSGGSESSSGEPSDGGGSSGSSGSSGNGDGGASSGEVRVGTLTIMSNAYTVGTTPIEQGTAYGSFYRYTPAASGSSSGGCAVQTVGACAVNTCTFGTTSTGDAGNGVTYTNSGTVTVSGVRVNSGSMTLTPGGYGYTTVSGSVAFFVGGENVRLAAPGNPTGAPAFDVALVAPSSVPVSAPVFDAQSSVSTSASQDLAVAWGSTPAAEVAVAISAGGTGKSVQARCAFPAGAGRGAVPAQVLASVQALGAATTSIVVSAESRKVQTLAGWDLTVTLQAYGIRAGGGAAGLAAGTLKFR